MQSLGVDPLRCLALGILGLVVSMIRVTVDFNSLLPEPDDRVPIGVEGQPEIKPYLQEGLGVLLCTSDLEVEGNMQFDEEYSSWLAKPDWSTQRDV